jgi:hypothetical protein
VANAAKDPRFPVAVLPLLAYEIRHSEPVFRRARNSRLDFLMLSAMPMQRYNAGPNSWTTLVAFDYVDAGQVFPLGFRSRVILISRTSARGSNKDWSMGKSPRWTDPRLVFLDDRRIDKREIYARQD